MFKVLLVEDEDIIRNGLKYTIDWLSIDCVIVGEATNGEEGLQKIVELEPDIVILDVNMPIKNGIEMLEESGEEHIYSSIIISGHDDFAYAKKGITLGVSDYLLKPVDHHQLVEAVKKAKDVVMLKKQYHYIQTNVTKPDEISVLNLDLLTEPYHTSKVVVSMIDYIKEHYREKVSIQDLVKELDRSATYLNQKFKEHTSYTFNEFVNRYRIQKAIDSLKVGEEKISMIALDVGFSDYRYFINIFKKYTKALPSDFLEFFKNKQ